MLYNKTRPRQFDDVIGQPSIDIIRSQIKRKSLPHTIILAGPPGTGKTSTARLLAAFLVCRKPKRGNPCLKCGCQNVFEGSHWDVSEIDGSSSRGIDESRELAYRAQITPVGQAKVYIVDECHGLTEYAWNSLLKATEEPPDYMTWVFVTSEASRIPDTIKSRSAGFGFFKLEAKTMTDLMVKNATNVSPATLRYIAEMSDGDMRSAYVKLDALSAMEPASVQKQKKALQAMLV